MNEKYYRAIGRKISPWKPTKENYETLVLSINVSSKLLNEKKISKLITFEICDRKPKKN